MAGPNPSVLYQQKSFRAEGSATTKNFRHGAHRAIEPEQTLARLQPLLASMEITRVADITGLDVIGLPVAVAMRPNARSNAVFQGKGLTRAAAKVSAIMEAVETYHAERLQGPLLWADARELRQKGYRLIDVQRLSRRTGAAFTDDTKTLWIEGRHLADDAPCLLPYEIAHVNFTLPSPAGSGYFLASTNGLASGNNRVEALVHAACEAIERDCQILFDLDSTALDSRRLDLASVDDIDALWAIDRIKAAGLLCAVWSLTSDIGIAAFRCHIMERDGGPAVMPLPAEGHGCHPDRGIALVRALLEAAQTRATVIAGTRDDVGPDFYRRMDDPAHLAEWRARLASTSSACRFDAVPHCGFETIDEDLAHIVAQLRSADLDEIVVLDLSPAEAPFAVVRVVVPGLEGPPGPNIILGARARRHLETMR
jgi:ribosomal protein S12 methylthiotransferase accessory factor